MSFLSTYTLDLSNLKVIDSCYSKRSDWDELICENEGRFVKEDEFIMFDMNGLELVVTFDLDVSGRIDYDPGDYYTPPYTDVDITDEDIDIKQITLDEYDVELDKELKIIFSELIQKNI